MVGGAEGGVTPAVGGFVESGTGAADAMLRKRDEIGHDGLLGQGGRAGGVRGDPSITGNTGNLVVHWTQPEASHNLV